ncbi:thiol-disulfide oxidoreductase DCC family protein [Oceanobacillus manasiensis]|uniref:thiol-disulfide oxidoreductase DCC family protein n=1 Tax=Oceanobacillus manasiensis TaxID=586413 RepID=UPI0005A697B8|nr:thiol-disulfide oxidoreductase DCC family protein [Oceanobacillus manasiensis]
MKLILFDGECNFCDRSVQFVMKRDPEAIFTFASLQSGAGERVKEHYNINPSLDSMILVEGETYYTKSTAALKICRNLKGFWKVFSVLLVIPKPIRDFFYNIVARNRYKWFGKRETCRLPSPEERARFLEERTELNLP